MKLHDIAHGRAGDKGDISNISVIAFRPQDWPLIDAAVTSERVAQQLGIADVGDIERHCLPKLHALNFVVRGALAGGVTRSLALDAHGKCLASLLLDIEL